MTSEIARVKAEFQTLFARAKRIRDPVEKGRLLMHCNALLGMINQLLREESQRVRQVSDRAFRQSGSR